MDVKAIVPVEKSLAVGSLKAITFMQSLAFGALRLLEGPSGKLSPVINCPFKLACCHELKAAIMAVDTGVPPVTFTLGAFGFKLQATASLQAAGGNNGAPLAHHRVATGPFTSSCSWL